MNLAKLPVKEFKLLRMLDDKITKKEAFFHIFLVNTINCCDINSFQITNNSLPGSLKKISQIFSKNKNKSILRSRSINIIFFEKSCYRTLDSCFRYKFGSKNRNFYI